MSTVLHLCIHTEPGEECAYKDPMAYLEGRWLQPLIDFMRRRRAGRLMAVTVRRDWCAAPAGWQSEVSFDCETGPLDLEGVYRTFNPDTVPELLRTGAPS